MSENITLSEIDSTSRKITYDPTQNAIYIPGFTCGYVITNDSVGSEIKVGTRFELEDYAYVLTNDKTAQLGKTYYKKIDESVYNEITFCQTVVEFENKFGTTPYKFVNNQNSVSGNTTYNKITVIVGETTVTGYYTKQDDDYIEITEKDKKAEEGVDYYEKVESGTTHTINIKVGDFDKSYIMAKMLLNLGVYVYYDAFKISDKEADTVKDFYSKVASQIKVLEDLSTYNIKFITTGGYESFGNVDSSNKQLDETITETMFKTACERNECTALVTYNADVIKKTNILNVINEIPQYLVITGQNTEDASDYGTMFASNGKYNINNLFGGMVETNTIELPNSFGYLVAFATSAQTNPNWYAVAGVARGVVPYLVEPVEKLNGKEAEQLTPDSGRAINPIIHINPYGYCIWGNRTLHDNTYTENGVPKLVARSFLNIRVLANDIKKILRNVALSLSFEIKSEKLWLNFKSQVESQLDKIVASNGIEKYKLSQVETNERGKVRVKLSIWCQYAIEKWDMEVELTDSYVSTVE